MSVTIAVHKHPETADEYLTDALFCALVHVDPRTSLRWRSDGGGPPFIRLGPRRILYARAAVNDWLATRTFAHRAEEAVATEIAAQHVA